MLNIEEEELLDQPNSFQSHAIMHDNIESVDGVNDREKCLSEEKKITKKKKNTLNNI